MYQHQYTRPDGIRQGDDAPEAQNGSQGDRSNGHYDHSQVQAWKSYINISDKEAFIVAKRSDGKFTRLGYDIQKVINNHELNVWMHVNRLPSWFAQTKAEISEICAIENIILDFEYPSNPPIAHAVAQYMKDLLVAQGILDIDQPIEDSGAGDHINVPVGTIQIWRDDDDAIRRNEAERKRRGSLFNDAVKEVVKDYFLPAFEQAKRECGASANMNLISMEISRVLSIPGTWRYSTKPDDCAMLKDGYLRRWHEPYTDGNWPVRHNNDRVRQLIIDVINRYEQEEKTGQRQQQSNASQGSGGAQNGRARNGGETITVEQLPLDFLEQVKKSSQLTYDRIFSEETASHSNPKPQLREKDGGIDRSSNDWFITSSLLSLGYSKGQVAAVLTHEEWFSGARFRERPNSTYVYETIQKASAALDSDPNQFFELVGTSRTPRFIPNKMMKALIKSGTRFLRLLGQDDVQVDGLWRYHNGVYLRTGVQHVKEECVVRLGKLWKSTHAEEVIKWMVSNREIPSHILFDDPVRLTAKECFINTSRGMVNVSSGKIFTHDPSYRSFLQLPVKYDPSVGPGAVDAFIREVLPADAVGTFWEFVGYCMLLDCRYKKALFLLGDRDSGKSTICSLLKRFFGRNGSISTALQELCDSRFEFANLLHKFANIYPDLPSTELKNYGRFKGMTSGDSDKGEHKFERSFAFSATAKHIFSANAFVPTADPEVDAYCNRWIIIKLEHVFRDEVGDGVQKANTHLIEDLSTPQCMSEMFNLALAGLQRLLKNDRFTKSASITAAGNEYREMLDSVYSYIDHATEEAPDGFIAKATMMKGYGQYCSSGENRFPVGGPKFNQRMKSIMRKFKMREGMKRMEVTVATVKDGVTTTTPEEQEVHGYWGRKFKPEHVPSNSTITVVKRGR